MTKSEKPIRSWDLENSALRPEYRSISCELRALAGTVHSEIGKQQQVSNDSASGSANPSPFFERGRLYELYSARRNERLKRKKCEATTVEEKTPYRLGVTVESSKKRDSRKLGSLKKSVSAAYSVEGSQSHRYMLRSRTKENKKPPLAAAAAAANTVTSSKSVARRVVRI